MPTDKQEKERAELLRKTWRLLGEDRVREALQACEGLNQLYPDHADGWHVASHVAQRLGNLPEALALVDRASQLEADNPVWKLRRAQCLQAVDRKAEAIELAESLSNEHFAVAVHYTSLGGLLLTQERYEMAQLCYEHALSLEPNRGGHHYNIATVQRFRGRLDDAEASCNEAIRLDPEDFEAYGLRSDLRRQTTHRNHVPELEERLAGGINSWRGRVQIHHALAKEYEDLGDYDKSFDRLARGASERRRHMQYDVARDEKTIARIIDVFDDTLFNGHIPGGDSGESIFVIGLPRTGTTLLERVLGSHTDVYSAGELNNFAMVLTDMASEAAGGKSIERDDMVTLCTRLDYAELGERYIKSTRPNTGKTPRFIDKLPLNYLYAGLIHLALPQARIVHLTRHPLDTCYAIYKRLFRDAYPFSYDLDELGRYFIAYYRLMAHWDRVMPGLIHHVRYEDLVANSESQVRHLLNYCDLPWQEGCLHFYKSIAASTTASASQVRQPVYQSSVGKWRHFEQELSPLRARLDAAGIPC